MPACLVSYHHSFNAISTMSFISLSRTCGSIYNVLSLLFSHVWSMAIFFILVLLSHLDRLDALQHQGRYPNHI